MKLIRESLDEAVPSNLRFERGLDPEKALDVGKHSQYSRNIRIKEWFDRMGIKKYAIDDYRSMDVDGVDEFVVALKSDLKLDVRVTENFNQHGTLEIFILDDWKILQTLQLGYIPAGKIAEDYGGEGFWLADQDGAELVPTGTKWEPFFRKIAEIKYGSPKAIDNKIKKTKEHLWELERIAKLYIQVK